MKFRAALTLLVAVAGFCPAQTVLPGLGGGYNAYVAAYGAPTAAGDTLIDAQERVWKLKGENLELHAFFRAGKAVEERWLRIGKDPWEKDELWHVLDGKAAGFRLVRRSEGVPSPYQAMDNSNGLLYFVVPDKSYGALLQRSARGPQIRIASRAWAAILAANGFGQAHRARPVATLKREAPRWGGLREGDLGELTRKLGRTKGKDAGKTWLLPGGAGEITWKTVASSASIVVRLTDKKLWKDWEATPAAKREDFRKECFARFGAQAYQLLPKLIGNLSWRVDRIEGTLPKWSPAGAVRLLDAKGTIGEGWKLDLVPEGLILQVDWPTGAVPGT